MADAIVRELSAKDEGTQRYFDGLQSLDLLADMVAQHCTARDGELDSMALSTNADAMRYLAKRGKLKILNEHGRRVVAKWASASPAPVGMDPRASCPKCAGTGELPGGEGCGCSSDEEETLGAS